MGLRIAKDKVFLLLGVPPQSRLARNVDFFEIIESGDKWVLQGYRKNGKIFGVPYELCETNPADSIRHDQVLKMQKQTLQFRGHLTAFR